MPQAVPAHAVHAAGCPRGTESHAAWRCLVFLLLLWRCTTLRLVAQDLSSLISARAQKSLSQSAWDPNLATAEADPEFSSTALCMLPLGCLYFAYLVWGTTLLYLTRGDANDTDCNKGELWWIIFTAVVVPCSKRCPRPATITLMLLSGGLVGFVQQAM